MRPRTLVLAAVAVAVANAARFSSEIHVIDDAWISFRVARNWVERGLPVFEPSIPPAEGMTNLLWTGLSALLLLAAPDLDPTIPARLGGLACYAATVVIAARLATRAAGDRPLAGAVTAGLLATSGSMAFHAVSGLETAAAGLLFVLAMSDLDGGRWTRAGVWLALGAATRPEGLLVGALGVLIAARGGLAAAARTAAPFAALVVAMEAFRLHTYGALLPNTFAAKPPDPAAGLRYVARFVAFTGGVGILGALPAVRVARPGAALAGVAGALAAGVAWSGGDWMPGYRRLTEVAIALAVLVGIGVGVRSRLAIAGALAWLVGSGVAAARAVDSGRYYHPALAWIAGLVERTPGVDSVALYDIGRFGWVFRGEIFDLGALTDARLAAAPGRMGEKWDEAWFRERSPDLVVLCVVGDVTPPLNERPELRAPDAAVYASMRDHGGYTLRAAVPMLRTATALVYARDGLSLPTDIWGPVPPGPSAP
ncbi:MAG: hypothetical protein ACOZNI_09385 [Myxococcota bacterium]